MLQSESIFAAIATGGCGLEALLRLFDLVESSGPKIDANNDMG
jgi:hypothetical protein